MLEPHTLHFRANGADILGDDEEENLYFTPLCEGEDQHTFYIGMLKQNHVYTFKFKLASTNNLHVVDEPNNNNTHITVRLLDDATTPQIWECNFIAKEKGETSEIIRLSSENGDVIRVKIGAKIIPINMGTPVLKRGVKCIGKNDDVSEEDSDWAGFENNKPPKRSAHKKNNNNNHNHNHNNT